MTASPDVRVMAREEKLKQVFLRAAKLLPGEAGQALLAVVSPGALATMVGVLVVWAGAHFFGVGEIADVVLLIVGYAAIGGVAIEAAKELFEFGRLTLNAASNADLDKAAAHLAKAISLIGVQTVLALLMKKKPGDIFDKPLTRMRPAPSVAEIEAALPKSPGLFYKPKLVFTRAKWAGEGGTNVAGDIRLGRDFFGDAGKAAEQVKYALYHEKVHQVLTPRLQIFRGFRVKLAREGYRNSFILRYLEEALAETVSQLRMNGLSAEYILKGLKFPFDGNYEITVTALVTEGKGILIGPITVGGMIYQVYFGARMPDE
jgi:hypothetical protein